MRFIATVFVMLACALTVSAQRVGVAYWNVDRLYDTEASPFYNDDDFTPDGRYGWNDERYRRKVTAVAAVIDSMSMPVTILYGVENESVVRDIAAACRNDYSYIHRTLNSLNGMDFALLYFGDALLPERVETDRRNVRIECRVAGRETVLLLCRDADDARRMAAAARREKPDAALIVAGRLNPQRMKALGLDDTFAREERAGRGESLHGGEWRFGDRICTDTLLTARAAVYARRELFDPAGRAPLPTVSGGRYKGGVSRCLPLMVTVEWPPEVRPHSKK